MTAARHLFLAAKRCEIDGLKQLATTSDIVGDISCFIHALQKERGASNVYLASGGERFAAERRECVAESLQSEQLSRQRLDVLVDNNARSAASARLLARTARVWWALDELETLRRDIEAQVLSADAATQAFNTLIRELLSVVFEAADSTTDPQITRALVAIFHFMQGKELAGQERACGAIGFTAGGFDEEHYKLLNYLINAQKRCFETFCEFASAASQQRWHDGLPLRTLSDLQKLRDMACHDLSAASQTHDLGESWYELATLRIDAMQRVEQALTHELASMCHARIDDAQRELAELERQKHTRSGFNSGAIEPTGHRQPLDLVDGDITDALAAFADSPLDSSFNRSLLELTKAQATRLESLGHELENTRKALRDRKLIERAKGLVMSSRQMTEEEAYAFMRKTAMDQSKSMAELARAILDLADILTSSNQK